MCVCISPLLGEMVAMCVCISPHFPLGSDFQVILVDSLVCAACLLIRSSQELFNWWSLVVCVVAAAIAQS
jgi:hypothetical protein